MQNQKIIKFQKYLSQSQVHPLKKSYDLKDTMTQSTLIKQQNISSSRRIIKNLNSSIQLHQVYNNYINKVDLSNQKDKLFKENIQLRRQIRNLQDQIIDSKFKANLWNIIKQKILKHPVSNGMITKKHGGCDSSFLKEFLEIIFDEGQSPRKSVPSVTSGYNIFNSQSLFQRVNSSKTFNIQHKNKSIDNLQKELQQKNRKLIKLEYQFNLLKEHNSFFQNNNKIDKNLKLKSLENLLLQKMNKINIIQERQIKLQEIIKSLKKDYESVLIRCQKNQNKIKQLQVQLQFQLKKNNEQNNIKKNYNIQKQTQRYNLKNQIVLLIEGQQRKNNIQMSNLQLLKQRQYDQQQIKRLKDKCDHLNNQLNKLIKTMNNFRIKMSGNRLNVNQFDRISQSLDYQLSQFDKLSLYSLKRVQSKY